MLFFIIPSLVLLLALFWSTFVFAPFLFFRLGTTLGWTLRNRTQDRRAALLKRVARDQKDFAETKTTVDDDEWESVESYAVGSAKNGASADVDWAGIIGFLHPFCNAGGGGERVLWAAIRATQKRWPNAVCVVYTGDEDADKTSMIERVKTRFNINLHPPTIVFLYLSTRHYVLGSTYPHFTLMGQSLGSLIMAYDAFTLLVPDILIDTMGYSFALALSKYLFPHVPTGCYTHFPVISLDMLGSLEEGGQGVNGGAGSGLKGVLKRAYWVVFAKLYSWTGGDIDVVMTNSSWTQNHIKQIWGPSRASMHKERPIEVVFPPVAVEGIAEAVTIGKNPREPLILYIAQFRPEKNHELILQAFSSFKASASKASSDARLVLIGSVRNSDDALRVYNLRLLANELKIKEDVEFIRDATWSQILEWLGKSWIGVNGMWNEHFGIGVVEKQAAGDICVVHNSGGPKLDIVIDYNGGPTGFHATTAQEFAQAFDKALSLSPEETLTMRQRAQASAKRFTEAAFAARWITQTETLINLQLQHPPLRAPN